MKKKQSWSIKEFMQMQNQKSNSGISINKTIDNEVNDKLVKVNFFLEETKKEVLKAPKIEQKKYAKVLYQTYVTTIALLTTTTQTFAASTYHLPPEVNQGIVTIQLICLALAGGLAIICWMLSGFLKMLGLQEKMKQWDQNIIKGLVQVLSAPIVILTITTILKLILHMIPGYRSF